MASEHFEDVPKDGHTLAVHAQQWGRCAITRYAPFVSFSVGFWDAARAVALLEEIGSMDCDDGADGGTAANEVAGVAFCFLDGGGDTNEGGIVALCVLEGSGAADEGGGPGGGAA